MTLHARDLMEPDPITVSPETPLVGVHQLFVEEEINGAPVVDDSGKVLGVISSLDLLRAVQDEYGRGVATGPAYLREELPYSGPDWAGAPQDFQDRLGQLTAMDAAIPDVVTVGPDATLAQVASTMRRERIHRVFVVEDGRLLGILTTFDLLRALEEPKGTS
jgi:CBS domain-containing protein